MENPNVSSSAEYIPATPASLQNIFSDCEDFQCRQISVGGGNELLWLCWLDGMVDGDAVAEQVIRPLTDSDRFSSSDDILSLAAHGLIYADTISQCPTAQAVAQELFRGCCALLHGGCALCFQLKSDKRRAVEQPQAEKTVKGGKDAFTETLRVNTSLVRNRLRTPRLKLHQLTVGHTGANPVALLWLEGSTPQELVDAARQRLEAIDCEALTEANLLENALSDHPASPFPQVMHTERSDCFAMSLLSGRVGILAEGLPLGFLVPGTLPAMMCPAEDQSQHFLIASALRLIRWAALLLTLFLPAFYTATAMYHQEMIPMKLLLSVIEAKQNVPFSTAAEILGMLVAFELLQEAGLRLPDPVGQTVSIVGALIVGQSAVEARVISPIAVIVVAVAGIAGYTVPNQDLSAALRLTRFALVLAAAAGGMFALTAAAALLVWHLCSLESFGTAYMSPLGSGHAGSGLRTLTRSPADRFSRPFHRKEGRL